MIDIEGTTLTPEDCDLLRHPFVGGLILFSRNYESVAQLKTLTHQIKQCRPNILITVDQEGGRVQRFQEEFTRIPPMATLGKLYDTDTIKARTLAHEIGWLLGRELIDCGIDMSFTPVVDINKNMSSVIGDRAFHSEACVVATLAKALIAGLNEAGMASCLKHFPGHGSVSADSHLTLPVDSRSLEAIKNDDLQAFIPLLSSPRTAVMMAHIIFSCEDKLPAGFSPFWIEEVLRKRYPFKGIVFSDDLSMVGAHDIGPPPTRVKVALAAGCDMVLMCNDRQAVLEILKDTSLYPRKNPQLLDYLAHKPELSTQELTRNSQRIDRIKHQLSELNGFK